MQNERERTDAYDGEEIYTQNTAQQFECGEPGALKGIIPTLKPWQRILSPRGEGRAKRRESETATEREKIKGKQRKLLSVLKKHWRKKNIKLL